MLSKQFLKDFIPLLRQSFARVRPALSNITRKYSTPRRAYALFNRAVKAGAKIEMPLENQFWGDRYGKIRDPFGHRWGLAQHVEDVSPEEMKKRSEAFANKMSKAAGK